MSNTVNVLTTTNQVVITPPSTKTVSINSGGDTSITVNQGAANTVSISNNVVDTSLTPNTVNITTPPSNGITVTDLSTTITVNQGTTSTVQVASIGPQGPKGDTGATGPQGPSGSVQDTGSFIITASSNNTNRIQYTKGDGSTFDNTINNVLNATSASYAVTSSYILADNVDQPFTSITASIISASNNITASNIYSTEDLSIIANGDISLSGTSQTDNIISLSPFNISSSLYVDGIVDVNYSGGSTYQIRSTEHILFNSFTGSDDPGNPAIIYLPRVASSENRQIRFLTDSTLSNNSKEIHIYPNASDTLVTIDGAAFYELERSYDGVMLMVHRGQWWVIQRKQK